MKTITYRFCDGTVSETAVSDELYAVIAGMDKREQLDERRETRRHISLNYLNEYGIDIEDGGGDPFTALVQKEDKAAYDKMLSVLTAEQRELLESVYIDGLTLTEIARQKGVSQQAISKRIAVIIKKLKKSF